MDIMFQYLHLCLPGQGHHNANLPSAAWIKHFYISSDLISSEEISNEREESWAQPKANESA